MCCFHKRIVSPAGRRLRAARAVAGDERGAAALEGIIVSAALAGAFFFCLLVGQWGANLQSAQMGARLLAFDAGDVELAKLGRPSNQPVQQFASETWDTLFNSETSGWLGGMFALSDDHFSGSVTGEVSGRLPSGTSSLFEYAPTTMGYRADDRTAASNSWGMPESVVRLTFLNLSYYVARYQVSPDGLDSTYAQAIPYTTPVLETIFGRVGIR